MDRARRTLSAMAVVMGDVDLVRALWLAGIGSAFFGIPDATARFSRHVRTILPAIEGWERDREADAVEVLVGFARSQPEPLVLYPQTDPALLLASRNRDVLGRVLRLSLADADLIEQLVDKGPFQALAERHGLPVPAAERLRPQPEQPPPQLTVPFPVIVKPVVRVSNWFALAEQAKAMRVGGPGEWRERWPQLVSRSPICALHTRAGCRRSPGCAGRDDAEPFPGWRPTTRFRSSGGRSGRPRRPGCAG
jgi:D-aspartate ligase